MKKQNFVLIVGIIIIALLCKQDLFSFIGTEYAGTLRCEEGDEWWCDHPYNLATASTVDIGNYQVKFEKTHENRIYTTIKCADVYAPTSSKSPYDTYFSSNYACNNVCSPKASYEETSVVYEGQEYVNVGIIPSACKKVTYDLRWPTCWRYSGRWRCGDYETATWTVGGLSRRSELRRGCYQRMTITNNGMQVYKTPFDLLWQYNYIPNSETYSDNNLVVSSFESSQWLGNVNTCYHISNGITIQAPKLTPSYEIKEDGSVDLTFNYNYGLFDSINANITTTYDDDSVESRIVELSKTNELINIPTSSDPIKIDVVYLIPASELDGLNGVCYGDVDTKQKSVAEYCDYVNIGGFTTDIIKDEEPEEIVEEEPEPVQEQIVVTEEAQTTFFEPTSEDITTGGILPEDASKVTFYLLMLGVLYIYLTYEDKFRKRK